MLAKNSAPTRMKTPAIAVKQKINATIECATFGALMRKKAPPIATVAKMKKITFSAIMLMSTITLPPEP